MCDTCGSCDLLKSLKIYEEHLKKSCCNQQQTNSIRRQMNQGTKVLTEFLLPGSNRKSTDIFWCIKIEGEGAAPANNDYGFVIRERCNYMRGRFLEKVSEKKQINHS